MTEPGFNEDAPNFWAMTDEAWLSYRRWLSGESAERDMTSLKGLEFTPSCEACDQPAVAYTEFHPAGVCNHPVFEDNLRKQLVCQDHLNELEDSSHRIFAYLNPRRCFRKRDAGRCPSCKTTIQKPEDILSVIRWLK